MYIRATTDADVTLLNAWRAKHGLVPVPGHDVPKLGLIVPNLGMAYLRMAEGNLAIMDSLITNPDASSAMRHQALELLWPALLAAAHNAGCTRVWGVTSNTETFMRATQHGFVMRPGVLLVKE